MALAILLGVLLPDRIPTRPFVAPASPADASVFLMGAVKHLGVYSYTDGMNVRDAIVTAGGLTAPASDITIVIHRRIDDRPRQILAMPDTAIQPTDCLEVRRVNRSVAVYATSRASDPRRPLRPFPC